LTTPEGRVKKYLRKRIRALGGEVRFLKYIGRRNCPDALVLLPDRRPMVETKAELANGKLSTGQEREIQMLRDYGMEVLVLTTIEAIDNEFPLSN
jgi:hypothetical protein